MDVDNQSAQVVPDITTAVVLVQIATLGQCTKMLLEGVAAGTGQFDGLADGDASMTFLAWSVGAKQRNNDSEKHYETGEQ